MPFRTHMKVSNFNMLQENNINLGENQSEEDVNIKVPCEFDLMILKLPSITKEDIRALYDDMVKSNLID